MPLDALRIGQDLVDVPRFRRALAGRHERWQRRVFGPAEWSQAHAERDPEAALASCFAAKEAAFKALGTGWGRGVAWRDVEVRLDAKGLPTLLLTGQAAAIARETGLDLSVSLARTPLLAVALVIAQPRPRAQATARRGAGPPDR